MWVKLVAVGEGREGAQTMAGGRQWAVRRQQQLQQLPWLLMVVLGAWSSPRAAVAISLPDEGK